MIQVSAILAYPLHVLVEGILLLADSMLDVTWAELAARTAVGHRQGITIRAAVVGPDVLVTASVRHLGRVRDNWAQVRVRAWDGVEPWDDYHRREAEEICASMARKLAAREKR